MSDLTFKQWHYRETGQAYKINLTGYPVTTVSGAWYFQQKKINQLENQLAEYESSHKGACSTCEPVGILNQKLEKQLEVAVKFLNEISRDESEHGWQTAVDAKEALEQINALEEHSQSVIGRSDMEDA